jgi:hypothetical protein
LPGGARDSVESCLGGPHDGRGEIAMKGREDSGRGGAPRGGDSAWPSLDPKLDDESAEDMISPEQLIGYFGEPARTVERRDEHEHEHDRGDEDGDDTNRLPRITHAPDGIKVEEHRVGRAIAQWVLHVRCECGRRWFEVEAVDTTSCPRCGLLVYVDVDAQSART